MKINGRKKRETEYAMIHRGPGSSLCSILKLISHYWERMMETTKKQHGAASLHPCLVGVGGSYAAVVVEPGWTTVAWWPTKPETNSLDTESCAAPKKSFTRHQSLWRLGGNSVRVEPQVFCQIKTISELNFEDNWNSHIWYKVVIVRVFFKKLEFYSQC